MIAEALALLLLTTRCDQACIDDAYNGGEFIKQKSVCRCFVDIKSDIMLKRQIVLPAYGREEDEQ